MLIRATGILVTAAALACASRVAAEAGEYAPLNCARANSPAEHAICGSYALGQSEARTATLFSIATSLVAMGQRGEIQDAQRKWLASRDSCGRNLDCLSKAYDARIRALSNVIASIASRGPY